MRVIIFTFIRRIDSTIVYIIIILITLVVIAI